MPCGMLVPMGVEYTNRKGDVYYLHAGKRRTGKPNYYFSRDPRGQLVDSIPAGFEIYESPEAGLVHLRKVKPVAVLPFEREMVCEGIRRSAKLDYFIVEAQGNALTVYLSVAADDLPIMLAEARGFFSPEKLRSERDWRMRQSAYVKVMRFVLVDEDKRLFRVERWCFRGGIDNWFFLRGPAPLEKLVGTYAKHLGQESFFDLM